MPTEVRKAGVHSLLRSVTVAAALAALVFVLQSCGGSPAPTTAVQSAGPPQTASATTAPPTTAVAVTAAPITTPPSTAPPTSTPARATTTVRKAVPTTAHTTTTTGVPESDPALDAQYPCPDDLPPVVDGVPLCELAQEIRADAASRSEPAPFNMKVGVGTERQSHLAMNWQGATYDYGSDIPVYVVSAEGYFGRCTTCVGSIMNVGQQTSTSSTEPPPPELGAIWRVRPVVPPGPGGGGSGVHYDMSVFPKVYSVDAY